jgi:hypothetical protein
MTPHNPEPTEPDALWISSLNGIPVAAFDDESRARAFHARRVEQAAKFATPEAVTKTPIGPFVWSLHQVPYNEGTTP